VMFQVEVFWVVTPCSAVHLQGEDGGGMDFWNVSFLPQHYTASQPRRPRFKYLSYIVNSFLLVTKSIPYCSESCLSGNIRSFIFHVLI
jgi:hypothetical protein